jgi:acetyltransferase-like isoleucine patch superfamily enzyme
MLVRKFRSLVKKINRSLINAQSKLKIFLLEENIKLGKNVYIGKNTTIRTTDGGKIFIEDNISIESNCYIYV